MVPGQKSRPGSASDCFGLLPAWSMSGVHGASPRRLEVQSLAIFGLMSMTWTSSVSSTTNFLRVALLDLDQLGFGHLDGLGHPK